MPTPNVMLPVPLPTQSSLRKAVAEIIRGVQLDFGLTDKQFAEQLCVSAGTIGNARNEECDLNATTIARIGHRFGVERLDPYAGLYGARNVPREAEDVDALPSLTGAVHRLAVAQSPNSPGGVAITHTELLAMLPVLRDAQHAINAMIRRAEQIAA